MVTAAEILLHVDALVARFHPERVLLFGSYALGEPTSDSDVDLLVVMGHRRRGQDLAARIRAEVPAAFARDVLVLSSTELRRRLADGCVVFRDLLKTGIVLYDRNNPGMDREGRKRLRRRLAAAAVAETQPI